MAAAPGKPTGSKTLEELSATKAIQLLSQSQTSDLDFASLAPIQQQLVFKHLIRDYQRLRNKDEKLCRALKGIPHLDQLLYGIPADIVEENWRRDFAHDESMEPTTQVSEPGSGEDNDQAGTDNQTSEDESKDIDDDFMATFRSHWGYTDSYEDADLEWVLYYDWEHGLQPATNWCSSRLRAHSIDSDLHLHPDGIRIDDEGDIIPRCRISSHLFLYRVIGVFGMPPDIGPRWEPSTGWDWFDTEWAVKLIHNAESFLLLSNVDGELHLEFRGTAAASDDAIALINLLTR